nr:putative copia-type protein [Tanacetum cinerariifolium]
MSNCLVSDCVPTFVSPAPATNIAYANYVVHPTDTTLIITGPVIRPNSSKDYVGLSFSLVWRRSVRSQDELLELTDLKNLILKLRLSMEQDTWEFTPEPSRLLTRVNIYHSGIALDSVRCPLCSDDIETETHVFINCSLTCCIWKDVFSWWQLPDTSFTNLDYLFSLPDRVTMESKLKPFFDVVVNASIWSLWSYKNKVLFNIKRGTAKGLAEALWIRKLVSEIGFPFRGSTQIICDNKAAIQISKNLVQHDRTKHVEVDRHFIKEKLEAGIIELPFVKSSDQLADILTKAVGTDMFHKCLSKLNFRNPAIQLEGECWKRK